MNNEELEQTYEMLALHIDKVEETQVPIFLAKLALLMASEIDDIDVVRQCIEGALSKN